MSTVGRLGHGAQTSQRGVHRVVHQGAIIGRKKNEEMKMEKERERES